MKLTGTHATAWSQFCEVQCTFMLHRTGRGGHSQRTWRRKVRENRRGLPREARSRPHSVAVSLVPWGTPTCSRKPYAIPTTLRSAHVMVCIAGPYRSIVPLDHLCRSDIQGSARRALHNQHKQTKVHQPVKST